MDKEHGRVDTRTLVCCPINPSTIGLAGATQLIRIERDVQFLRKGKVIKTTHEVVFAVTTLWEDEASPKQLLELSRSHWSIENRQHHRRDRTQDEDRCTVRDTNTARILTLYRSLAIFLCETARPPKGPKLSLPDFQRRNCRNPWPLLRRFAPSQSPA